MTVHEKSTRKLDTAVTIATGFPDVEENRAVDSTNAPIQKPRDIPDEILIRMYQQMSLLREFDRRSVRLQRAGRIGTYPPLEGQEACQVASTLALRSQDFVVPTYRDYGAMMVHGVPMENIFMYWNGRTEGCEIPQNVNVFPIAVPIATQLPHAAGLAFAAKLKKEDQVALGFFGDGASSEGDFHEAMNFAGVFKLPVVFFCENNQYAISVPFERQTATQTIAEKARAYGVSGVRVPGWDAIAIYRAVRDAVTRAAEGGGPTLIEALTYRYGPHTTSDDPTKYRPEGEAEAWRHRDALHLLSQSLRSFGLWDDEQEAAIRENIDQTIRGAIAKMESLGPVNPLHLFDHVYASLPKYLQRQRDALLSELSAAAVTPSPREASR
ncbi:pyruvate dehydrogenase (acetyl-transferring) E1 component subunit alpha [Alicyclobacillus mengziensis]|nr:pyruvate dehydrogenase (acetyl-transferring) E1 component subunit alpha [Alicyclobacillus mengziensis]